MNKVFPFAAVLGQERVKTALMLNVVNPRIGGVLICGAKGTAKSTLVRGLAELTDGMEVVNLPLNVTEDRLVGSLDWEQAVRAGRKSFCPGLLYQAHGHFLYIDEVNLLGDSIVNILLEVASTGTNTVEREGLSYSHPARFALIGSMNPEEGSLRSQFIDKFGLYVETGGEKETAVRVAIMERRLAYEADPVGFCAQWQAANRKIRTILHRGRALLGGVKAGEEAQRTAAELAQAGRCAGHRAEITLVETAKALAALAGRTEATERDVRQAAAYALPHRIRESLTLESAPEQGKGEGRQEAEQQVRQSGGQPDRADEATDQDEATDREVSSEGLSPLNSGAGQGDGEPAAITESKEGDGGNDSASPVPGEDGTALTLEIKLSRRDRITGPGKRNKTRTDGRQGKYIRYRQPVGKTSDIALDATLRAAACRQKTRARERPGGKLGERLALTVRPEDIREKVRESRSGAVILFAVDSSGSMGAHKRMKAVRGAVMSLLNEAYQKRDKVGVVAFRQDRAEVLLSVTRSVDLAQKYLKNLPTGGRTPLALGLERAFQLLKGEKRKNPDCLLYLVVISDGKANVALRNGDPLADALQAGEAIRYEKISSMVLDTEQGYLQFGLAQKLAQAMDSRYVKLDKISGQEIRSNLLDLIHR